MSLNKSLEEEELVAFLKRFDAHPFTLMVGNRRYEIGKGESEFTVRFKELPTTKELLTSTSLALGEAYMDEKLVIEGDLYETLNLFLGQVGKFCTDHKHLKHLYKPSTSKHHQKEEVSSHYDIGNDFYRLWLDETLSYSCGYFKKENDTLYQAQVQKVDYILEKLHLQKGMTLCDIGCGWGFLLIEAAKRYGISGVGITLSEEQKKEFEKRIEAEGLSGQLQVKLMDYRDLMKSDMRFDRVVSVGMLEHVGKDHYELFLENVKSILNPGGVFLLHYISALKEYDGDAWIKKYIFPGGMIPSLREILTLAAEQRFFTVDVESLRRHYRQTLLCWNGNFQDKRKQVEEMFGSRFVKMWELYLCSCAAVFENGIVDLHQILFTNDVNNDLPMTRWY